MARRRAAGLLLALAACIATATAAPTASNHTSLDLYDGSPDGCYYNFQHYGEGDRIMTNEPCLNCTCHNRMLMCYLKVCPFTKPIGQDCTIEKRADQCCPIVTCPDVPVDLLTSTTTSPSEYGPTGMGKLDKYGCSINGKYFSEGSKVPPAPNKPCEHCYCIRNMTTCVMQECTLHVDGCTPIYHKDVCCPVRYSCDHPEDELPLLDDLSTTVRPTPGFLLTTTTVSPVTQMSQDCVYENQVFPDGALIKTEKACDHCYCMKGDIVCVVQECGTPMENEGKNCTALLPREGVCCPDTYICEGDEPITSTFEAYDHTTIIAQEELTTLSPPRRTISEGSGYRNEPDESPYTEIPELEPEMEGSGEEEIVPIKTIPQSVTSASVDDILSITEESHEFLPLTTSQPDIVTEITTDDVQITTGDISKQSSNSESDIPSTTPTYNIKEIDEFVTSTPQTPENGPSENEKIPIDEITQVPPMEVSEPTSDLNQIQKQHEPNKPNENEIIPIDEITHLPPMEDSVSTSDLNKKVENEPSDNENMPIDQITQLPPKEVSEPISDDNKKVETTSIMTQSSSSESSEEVTLTPTSSDDKTNMEPEGTQVEVTSSSEEESNESSTSGEQLSVTTIIPDIASSVTESVESTKPYIEHEFNTDSHHLTSSGMPNLDDEFVTTESQDADIVTESSKVPDISAPHKHFTASTPMLEEIEKEPIEYSGVDHIPTDTTLLSTTLSSIFKEKETESNILDTDSVPIKNQMSSTEPQKVPELSNESSTTVNIEYTPTTQQVPTYVSEDSDKLSTVSDMIQTSSEDGSKQHDIGSITTISILDSEGSSTEPDKGLNTIPSDILEDEIAMSHKDKTTTIIDEKLLTDSELDDTYGVDIGSKQTTPASPTIMHEGASILTTESTFRKEDSQTSKEKQETSDVMTESYDISKDLETTMAPDNVRSTETDLTQQKEMTSTSKPVYIDIVEETTVAKEDIIAPSYATTISITEGLQKESVPEKEISTTESSYEKLPETTVANQEDNEIFNEPRIPGEGDCLLNGITYPNESIVPSSSKCQSGCKCISSIVKCEPILCSLPPDMDKCETAYDTPDSCCPTYVCDHRSETNPPQSQSQMSGTDSPVLLPIDCHGDECVLLEDQQIHHEKPTPECKTGNCHDKIDEIIPKPEHVPEMPTEEQIHIPCSGDNCEPQICTKENGCETTTPVKLCDGEKCVVEPSAHEPSVQPCADGNECNILNVPIQACNTGNCGTTEIQSGDYQPTKTCSDNSGCDNTPETNIAPIEQNILDQCIGTECKQQQTGTETSTDKPAGLDYNTEENVTIDKENTAKPTDDSSKTDTTPSLGYEDKTSEQPQETHDKGLGTEKPVTTLYDDTELVTKPGSNIEITTKLNMFTEEEESTTEELETNLPEYTVGQEMLPSISTESTLGKDQTQLPISEETPLQSADISTSDKDITEASKVTSVDEMATELGATQSSSTEQPKDVFIDSQKQTTSMEEVTSKSPTTYTPELSTSSAFNADDINKPENTFEPQEVLDSTIKTNAESITEPTKIFVTDSQEITEVPTVISHDITTQKPHEVYITEDTIKVIQEQGKTTDSSLIDSKDMQTELSTLSDSDEKVTIPPTPTGDDDNTIKENTEMTAPKETQVTDEDVHKDSLEETSTKPPKILVTDSEETIKPFEDSTDKQYAHDIFDKYITEAPIFYSTIIDKTTPYPSDADKYVTFENSDINTIIPEKEIPDTSTEIVKTTATLQELSVTERQDKEPEDKTSETPHEKTTVAPAVDITEPSEMSTDSSAISQEDSIPTTETEHQSTESPQISETEGKETSQEATTSVIEESDITEPPKTFSTDKIELTPSKEIESDVTTESSPKLPEQSNTDFISKGTTEVSQLSDQFDLSETTPKAIENASELPISDVDNKYTESPEHTVSVTDKEKEISQPTLIETPIQKPESHQESTEIYTTTSPELTSHTIIDIEFESSRRTEPGPTTAEETVTVQTSPELLPPQSQFSTTTETVAKLTSTASPEQQKETETTIPATVQPHVSSDKPGLDMGLVSENQHTTLHPMLEQKDEHKPQLEGITSFVTSDDSTMTENVTPELIHTHTDIPSVIIQTDDSRATVSEIADVTTPLPIDDSTEPIEVTSKYPSKSQEAHTESQETFTEGISITTEKLIEPFITEAPAIGVETTSSRVTESEIVTSSSLPQKPSESEEPTKAVDENKYSSEDVVTESIKSTDNNIEEPVVTEKYLGNTSESDFEKDKDSLIPIQISSERPDGDITESLGANTIETDVSTLSSNDPDSTVRPQISQSVTSAETPHEYKTTASSIFDDATEKDNPPLSLPGHELSSTIADDRITTSNPTELPTVEVTTEFKPDTKDQESIDIQDQEVVTKISTDEHVTTLKPDQMLPETGSTSTTHPSETPASVTESDYLKPETEINIVTDQIITDNLESITQEPNAIPEIVTTFEPTKHEITSTNRPLEDVEHTNKEGDLTTIASEATTEKVKIIDDSVVSQPIETFTEKLLEPVTSDKVTDNADTTSKKPYTPEYETTSTYEITTQAPSLSEKDLTTPIPDILPEFISKTPEDEQAIPVAVTEVNKITTPKESDIIQPDKVTPASEKPLQETTAPEEEFLLATSKAPTTPKLEDEIAASSSPTETIPKSTEKPLEPTAVTETPKPISTDMQPTDEIPMPDEDGSFPPSGGTGYGQPTDYEEEDQTFGPGTCRYGGKVYVSAQQIPRDDPCDFCFCFRSDIICLQQSCPPPIHGCHEEPIQGFCCPRYECPVSMATTVNVTTTTTTTTTTLPPHFPTHSYKGSAQRRGCQIKGQTYKVGEVVRASSGPCLHCTCGGDGQMKCDPKVCTPEPMLRQMIAAAVSAKRRR